MAQPSISGGVQNAPGKPGGTFQQLTTRNRQMLSTVTFNAAGQYQEQQVFATGYLAYLKVLIYGTITTGTSSAGTFDANFWPDNLVKRLTLKSNANFTYYDTDGPGNRYVQRVMRLGLDPHLTVNPNTGTPYSTTGAKGFFFQAPTGARADSTAYPVAVQYLIPVVSHPDLRAGLLPLQNNATRVVLGIQLGSITDWLGSSGVLGVGGTVALTVSTEMEFYSIPNDMNAQPNTQFIHRIAQQDNQWTASGDFIFTYPVNGVVLRNWMLFNNAGVPAKFFATASTPTTNNFNNMTIRYAATQLPEVYDFRHMLYDYRFTYNEDITDGLFLFDLAVAGSPEMGLSGMNAINTRRLTELEFIVNTGLTPGANSLVTVYRQELQPRSAQ